MSSIISKTVIFKKHYEIVILWDKQKGYYFNISQTNNLINQYTSNKTYCNENNTLQAAKRLINKSILYNCLLTEV